MGLSFHRSTSGVDLPMKTMDPYALTYLDGLHTLITELAAERS